MFVAFLLLMGRAQADTIRVPDVAQGNSSTIAPFSADETMRYQQIYSTAAFSSLAGDVLITGINFGCEFPTPQFPPRVCIGVIERLEVRLSTTSRAVDNLSATFSENIGFDEVVVLTPRAVDYVYGFGLDQPYIYNPDAGNLLLDIRFGGFHTSVGLLDAENVLGDETSRVYAIGVDSLTGTMDTIGLVTTFVYTPVPEPSTAGLFALGVALTCFSVCCRVRAPRRTSILRGEDVIRG